MKGQQDSKAIKKPENIAFNSLNSPKSTFNLPGSKTQTYSISELIRFRHIIP